MKLAVMNNYSLLLLALQVAAGFYYDLLISLIKLYLLIACADAGLRVYA